MPRSLTPAEIAQFTSQQIHEAMVNLASNPRLLSEATSVGPVAFRNKFRQAFAGLPVDDEVANRVYAFLCGQVVRRARQFGVETETPSALLDYLDKTEVTKTAPTQDEIERAWEIESGSSEEGKRHFYGNRSADEVMRELRAQQERHDSEDRK